MLGGVTCILLLLALATSAEAAEFNVKKYGAKADGKSDDSKAIASAWQAACSSTNKSTITIGKGNYLVGSLMFQGPCKAKVTLKIQGNLKAPVDVKKLKSQDGWVVFQNIDGLLVNGGGTFDGQGSLAWSQNNCAKTGKCNSLPINLRFTSLSNSKIEDITSTDSKLFHMNILNCKNLTLENIVVDAPPGSLNTDGIHIGRSTGVNITGAVVKTGDDCVSIGDGSIQVNIEKVQCGPGHGISIGSLGRYHNEQPVNGITVRNCTITNTMFGVRIKTWPASPSGLATNMRFQDIRMNNVSNPLLIDQEYCPYGKCRAEVPSRVRLSDITFKNIRGTSATRIAVSLICSRGFPCQNVELNDINLKYNGKDGQAISECANVQPKLLGELIPPACSKTDD